MLIGFAHSFTVLLVLRLMLGLGESAGFPCASKILAAVVPPKGLGLRTASWLLPISSVLPWAFMPAAC